MLAPCLRRAFWYGRGARLLHTSFPMGKRNYGDAVAALNSLQSNFAVLDAIRASGRAMNEAAIPEMIEWCRRAGFDPAELDRLNAVHIAGTKGKGSTSAFISSILQQYTTPGQGNSGQSLGPSKIGLYTSPHLRFVRERIQVNGSPISEQDFADAFFSVWDKLEASTKQHPVPDGERAKPVYFRYLTLMAYSFYLSQRIDSAIIECGVGGEYDSTNVLQRPSVTGITSLGIDHTAVLGPTIEDIAWHKAGIMKSGTPAFTVPQPETALHVLRKRASEKNVNLEVVDIHPEIASGKAQLGLSGEFQKGNASLAVAIAAAQLKALGHSDIDTTILNDRFLQGLRDVQWGGRCETRVEPANGITWYIDGAHTLESVDAASQWFGEVVDFKKDAKSSSDQSSKKPIRILLFNQQQRTGAPLLQQLNAVVASKIGSEHIFEFAFFCSNVTFDEAGYRPDLMNVNASSQDVDALHVQKGLAEAWQAIDGQTQVSVLPTIEQAVRRIRQLAAEQRLQNEEDGKTSAATNNPAEHVQVFVVGSVHLIGGVLEVLESS